MTQEEFDDAVDAWHDDPNATMPLHEHLGMTWDEYTEYAMPSYDKIAKLRDKIAALRAENERLTKLVGERCCQNPIKFELS